MMISYTTLFNKNSHLRVVRCRQSTQNTRGHWMFPFSYISFLGTRQGMEIQTVSGASISVTTKLRRFFTSVSLSDNPKIRLLCYL